MTLAEEAQRYLAVVEFFRAEGVEPRWRPEQIELEPSKRPVENASDRRKP